MVRPATCIESLSDKDGQAASPVEQQQRQCKYMS
ncbi:hypothetical protein A2U01_0046546, partial [Trifolium medium]|nr:hypothetical protein [Trifolium medium]